MNTNHSSRIMNLKKWNSKIFATPKLGMFLMIVIQGFFFGLSGLTSASQAQTQCTTGETSASCPQLMKDRIQPSFSEEERRNLTQKGFSNTFLRDSLNGIGDPLGSSSIGGAKETNSALGPLSPQDRGILPAFDPTDVIVPRPAGRR